VFFVRGPGADRRARAVWHSRTMAGVTATLAPFAPFAPGVTLGGKYTLQSRLGSGAVGEVWAATNRSTRATVALKLVGAGTVSRDAASRFRHEAALSGPLSHRNIVRVYDFLEEPGGTLILVMERLRGENARERLLRTGLLPAASAVSIATQILSALEHAHANRIIHRDVKPPNLFLSTEPDGSITPKLLDFGIAKTEASTVHTLNGQLLGTPRYMSPEQIRGDTTLDGRSDLFSVATVLYELLTGRCPFAAAFSTASLALVLEGAVAPDPHIPAALWHVLEKAFAKEREARFGTADAFADALREAIQTSDASLSRVLLRSNPPPPLVIDSPLVRPLPGPPSIIVDDDDDVLRASARRRTRARRVMWGTVTASCLVLGAAVVRSIASAPAPVAEAPAHTSIVPAQPVSATATPVPAPAMERSASPTVALATAPTVGAAARVARGPAERTGAPVLPAKTAPAQTLTSSKAARTRAGLVKDPGF
jgi:serine/threonine protein kinase